MCGSVSGGCVENDVAEQARRGDRDGRAAAAELRDLRRRRRSASACRAAARSTSSSSASIERSATRLLELAHGDERAVLFTVVDGDRSAGAKLLVLLDRGEIDRRRAARRSPRWLPRSAAAACVEHRGHEGLRRGLRPAAAARRHRRGRHRRGALRRGAGARLAHDLRRRAGALRDARADPERRRDRRRVARGGARADRARSRHRRRRADARREVRRPGARRPRSRTDAFYVGALGCRRAQARRRERLLEAGLTRGSSSTRLHGPAGLDIGAESPAETAVSILAEALARARRPPRRRRCASRPSRIHVER